MLRQTFLSIILFSFALSVNGAESNRSLNPFEKMLSGFSTCELRGVFIDWQTNKAANPYLAQIAKTGMRIEGDFAHFKNINYTFHGFRVLELTIPAKTWTAHQLVLEAPHTKARPILERALRTKLPQTSPLPEGSEDVVPLLRAYPGKPQWSVLECDSPL